MTQHHPYETIMMNFCRSVQDAVPLPTVGCDSRHPIQKEYI
jgi:hypothetical protein